LRHDPQLAGLTLGEGGWVRVEDLLRGLRGLGVTLTLPELRAVVEGNDKQRFALDEREEHLRANQGHSVAVDLQLEAATPPDILYHGTSTAALPSILRQGILRMNRHHVHLSATVETALRVGGRHGQPVVLVVDARAMHAEGHAFFVSENGVWLTDAVPPRFVRRLDRDG
jgi:putative RNA 2'-phosphotransferase